MKTLALTILTTLMLSIGLRAAEMDTLRIYFDNGQTTVTDFQQGLIDIFLKTHFAAGQMIVAGHADNAGDNATNLKNSRLRAKMVAEYLVDKGIQPNNLLVEAWGETKPVAPNTDPVGRTRNRRVELIGLPYEISDLEVTGLSPKPLTLSNGTPIRYKEMTTEDGYKKYVFMIVLRKGDAIQIDTTNYNGLSYNGLSYKGASCGGFRPMVIDCPPMDPFIHKIRVDSNLKCPLDQLIYMNETVDAQKQLGHDKYFVFSPQPEDSAYYFKVPLQGIRACDTLGFVFGKDCYTVHDVRIVFQDLKVNYLRGKCAPMRDSQGAKRQPDGSYLLQYTNDAPENLQLFGQVTKGKHKKMAFKKVSLAKLTFDNERQAYVVTPKDVKRLRKQ